MADSNPTTKVCTKCNQVLPLDVFCKDRRSKNGLASHCKPCNAVMCAEYYQRNRDISIQKRHEYYARTRQARLEAFKRYRAANPEKVKEQARAQYQATREHVKKKARLWFQQNKARAVESRRRYKDQHREHLNACARERAKARPEARRAAKKKNKAKRAQAPGTCTAEQWLAKVQYHGWRCFYCRVVLTSDTMHMEHRKPLSRGGSHWPANVAPSCVKCNLSKNNKTEAEFKATR